jgi:exopolysaccharide production protein ExoQ
VTARAARWRHAVPGMGVAVAALAVASAWVAFPPPAPTLALAALLALALGSVALAARRYGAATVWVSAVLLSLLAGEMVALPFGGQSAHLLWADLVLAVGVAVALVLGRLAVDVPRAPFLDRAAVFVAWCLAGLLLAVDPLGAIAEVKEWVAALVVGIVALHAARDERRARWLLGMVAVTGALIGLAMGYAALTSLFGPLLAIQLKIVDLPWGHTNYLAGLLILALPVTLGLLGHARSWWTRLLWLPVLGGQALGLALATSKGATLALAASVLLTFPLIRRQAMAPRIVLGLVAAVLVALFAAGPLRVVLDRRMQSSALDYSVSERVDIYALALDAFVRRPITGVGINCLASITERLRGRQTVPHNLELGYLAETGIVGLALVLAWVVALGRVFLAPLRAARTPGERSLAAGLLAVFIGFALHNQVESTIYGQQYKTLLVVTAAAAWGLARRWRAAPACAAHGTPAGSRTLHAD